MQRLRELAKKVREIAEDPLQQEHMRLWTKVNDLKMERPVMHTRDLSPRLLAHGDELAVETEDPFLQKLELDLLMRIYEWEHLRLHRVIKPEIRCQCVIKDTGFGLPSSTRQGETEYKTAISFEQKILSPADLEKIKLPRVYYDEEATMQNYYRMKEIFDGILEVKLFGRNYFRHVPWDDLLTWIGIEKGIYKFLEDPGFMHAAVTKYVEAAISQVKQYEELGVLSSNNCFDDIGHNDPGFTSHLPQPTESGIGAKLKDIWGSMSDQIMTTVSPAMSEEFAFGYEKQYSELFGLFGYGCCERLDHKVPALKKHFLNLRKVSISPFSNLEAGMEKLGRDYVVCFKPNSIYLAGTSFDLGYLQKELENVCRLAKKYNSNLVINMKTIINLGNDPSRLWKWCDMAVEVIDRY